MDDLPTKSACHGLPLATRLSNKSLLQCSSYVNGAWASLSGKSLNVNDPATDNPVMRVNQASIDLAIAAVESAKNAFSSWRKLLAKDRAALLHRWCELLLEHKRDLACIITTEQGKPLREAEGEIEYAAGFLKWFAEEGERIHGDMLQPHKPGRRMLTVREPVGVVAAITPWNFPSAMIVRKAGAALAAGCTMVVQPSEETPLSALALAALADEAGIPPGVFNVIVGQGAVTGEVLTAHPDVRSLSFTGSTAVGKMLLAQCAAGVKKVSLELGGHAPFIVFDDADLDKAIADAVEAKFVTSGQDCLAANRILVQRTIYDRFCDKFTEQVRGLKVGSGFQSDVDVGPLIHDRAVQRCEEQITDALSKGARLVAGGERHALGANFLSPTVLIGIEKNMKIFREETFGPVAGIMPFDTEEEALVLANDTEYGLAAYLYTENLRRIWRMGDVLEYGMIGVNTPSFTGAPIPFGGFKQSGLGREGGSIGLEDYLETKYLCLDVG